MDLVVVGGSDAGISAGLRARELDPDCHVTLIVADAYPNFSICGIPYFISGDVVDWRDLAHRTHADLLAAGLRLRLDTRALSIDAHRHELRVATADGAQETVSYDVLVVGTGAVPLIPPIRGLTGPDGLGPDDGVHLLHTMGETFALATDITQRQPATALIVGAGYIGVEMAEALTTKVENDTTCCYAVQDKVWVHGPGAEPWEVYTVKADAPDATSINPAGETGSCDCGSPSSESGVPLPACC